MENILIVVNTRWVNGEEEPVYGDGVRLSVKTIVATRDECPKGDTLEAHIMEKYMDYMDKEIYGPCYESLNNGNPTTLTINDHRMSPLVMNHLKAQGWVVDIPNTTVYPIKCLI